AAVQAGHTDLHFDVRFLWFFGDRDLAAYVGEPAAHLGDHQVPAHELHGRVGAIDVVDAGDGDEPVVMGPEHTDCSIRHGDQLLRLADVSTISEGWLSRQQKTRVGFFDGETAMARRTRSPPLAELAAPQPGAD